MRIDELLCIRYRIDINIVDEVDVTFRNKIVNNLVWLEAKFLDQDKEEELGEQRATYFHKFYDNGRFSNFIGWYPTRCFTLLIDL